MYQDCIVPASQTTVCSSIEETQRYIERMQHSSQITAVAADSKVSHSAYIRTPSVGLTLLLQ
jgi:hypothetical protein